MTGPVDLSAPSLLAKGIDLFFLLMLGALIYAAIVHVRRGRGMAARVMGWSALSCLLAFGLRFAAGSVQDGLRVLPESRETPEGPVSYETWELLGSLAEFLGGLALLVAGVALVYVGWGAGRARRRSRAR